MSGGQQGNGIKRDSGGGVSLRLPRDERAEQGIRRRTLHVDVTERLRDLHPDATTELEWQTPFQLLIATILAAQCTDKRVNEVTRTLFVDYPSPDAFANAPVEEPGEWADLRNHFLASRDPGTPEDFTGYRIGEHALVVADSRAEYGAETAMLSIHAADILLARDKPSRISARNVLPGRVTRIEKHGHRVLVFVDVGVEWMVHLTPAATDELQLSPGVETFAIVKASAISAVSA